MVGLETSAGCSTGAGSELDIETAISSFVADPSRSSLELPRLSTGQRKQAKKLANLHSELVCESYGFGAERRLHLFKRVAGEQDHCKAAPAEARDDRPLPPTLLPPEALQGCSDTSFDFDNSEDRSSRSTSASGQRPDTPATPVADLPKLPAQELQMRNTFIHFPHMSPDERAVQSLPHGMFGQALSAERQATKDVDFGSPKAAALTAAVGDCSTRRAAAEVVPATASDEQASNCSLRLGEEVMIEGLVKLPAFNGLTGVVQSLDEQTGRYNVYLFTSAYGRQWAKVKGEHLRPVVPPPPSVPPTIHIDSLDSD